MGGPERGEQYESNPQKYLLCYVMLCGLLFLNMTFVVSIWKQRLVAELLEKNTYVASVKRVGKNTLPIMGRKVVEISPTVSTITKKNYSIIMQYKVSGDNSGDIPEEMRGGDRLLMTRTYPKTPRKEKCHKCFEYVYNTVLRPKSCNAEGEIKVLIILTTVPNARPARDAIRKTWLSLTKNNTKSVRYMWLFGSGWPAKQQANIEKESQEFGDILQDNFIDSYYNLSIKVMGAYKFALTNCKRAEFILRTADDNYVNIPNILDLLQSKQSELQEGMFGQCGGASPIRGRGSKYSVTLNEWGNKRYPPYCTGTTFGMSALTMGKLFKAAQNVPYFVMEDVFFGEVCRQAGIKIKSQAFFLMGVPKINPKSATPCTVPKEWRAVHQVPPEKQLEMWKYCPQSKSIP